MFAALLEMVSECIFEYCVILNTVRWNLNAKHFFEIFFNSYKHFLPFFAFFGQLQLIVLFLTFRC